MSLLDGLDDDRHVKRLRNLDGELEKRKGQAPLTAHPWAERARHLLMEAEYCVVRVAAEERRNAEALAEQKKNSQ